MSTRSTDPCTDCNGLGVNRWGRLDDVGQRPQCTRCVGTGEEPECSCTADGDCSPCTELRLAREARTKAARLGVASTMLAPAKAVAS